MSNSAVPPVLFKNSVEAAQDDRFAAVAGSLIGAAVGDALGWCTEFVRGADHLRKIYRTDYVADFRSWQKRSGGRFNAYIDYINRGEYSDDTQLTLAVARSLLGDGAINVNHFAKVEMPLWLDYARGAGSTITAAARALQRRSTKWNSNFFGYKHRGEQRGYRIAGANGAAMRIGPIALANLHNQQRAYVGTWKNAITTHGHPRAILAALLHTEAVRVCASTAHGLTADRLLDGLGKFIASVVIPNEAGIQEWLVRWDQETPQPFEAKWEACKDEVLRGLSIIHEGKSREHIHPTMERLGCFEPATKGSGTSTVLAGLLIFKILGDDFRAAILEAVNALGSDTDTIAGFVGGLCGATHGYENVPHDWATELQDYDYFMRVATELDRISAGKGIGGPAILPERRGGLRDLPDLVHRLKTHEIARGERVYHELFGAGWVESVDAQMLNRKDGAQIVLASVRFDIGQSCKFRFMQIPRRRRAA